MRHLLVGILLSAAALVCAPVFGQDAPAPAWLLYEEGNALFEQREFGKALQRYKDAIDAAGNLPEAEVAIGDVYREEGELGLALAQYQKAWSRRNSLVVTNARYDIQYRIASVYRDQEMFKLMEDTLLAITADDPNWGKGQNTRLRTQVETLYFSKGLDQVLRLYRFADSFATRAHADLGWFYYRTGRFPQAVSHTLYAVIAGASEIARYHRERDVEWEFTSLEALLRSTAGNRELIEFAEGTDLYRNTYYLACSTWASMYPKLATGLWRLLGQLEEAGEYGDMSRRQLKKPWVEPYLIPLKKGAPG
jgi:tetratricopeptide (TPR) repeat protein